MGSAFTFGGDCKGVIPSAMQTLFDRIAAQEASHCTVRVQFVEIHKVRCWTGFLYGVPVL